MEGYQISSFTNAEGQGRHIGPGAKQSQSLAAFASCRLFTAIKPSKRPLIDMQH